MIANNGYCVVNQKNITMYNKKVTLRKKVLAKGMCGFYLDYSVQGKRKQETLNGIKLFVKLKDKRERDYNNQIQNKADEIRNNREQEIRANYYGETNFYKPKTLFCRVLRKDCS